MSSTNESLQNYRGLKLEIINRGRNDSSFECCAIHKRLCKALPSEPSCTCPELVSFPIKSKPQSLKNTNSNEIESLNSSSESIKHNLSSNMNTSFFSENLAYFKCPNCPFRTYNKRNLTSIKLMRNGSSVVIVCCPKCGTENCESNSGTEVESKKSLSHDSLLSQEELKLKFLCFNCGFRCKEKVLLRQHILAKHTQSNTFKCPFCPFTSLNKESFRRHKRSHVGEKRFACMNCNFKCAYKQSLARHIMRKHSSHRPFQCSTCSFSASNSSYLSRHTRRHTGELFQCDECDFRCTRKDNLKKHNALKHSDH